MRPSLLLIKILATWSLFAALTLALSILESAYEWFSVSDYLLQIWAISGTLLGLAALIDLTRLKENSVLDAQREISNNIAVGANTQVKLKLTNSSRRRLSVFVTDHYPEHSQIEHLPQNINIDTEQTAELSYQIKILQRGDALFGNIRLIIDSPLKLWQTVHKKECTQTVKVYPNFATIHHFILLSADQQTNQMGIRNSQKRGDGLEFHQLREYRTGDSLRQIDWRATSRLNKLISKEYQEEKDQNIIFLLDSGRRMRTQDCELSHFDHSLNAMLLLAYIGLKQGDAIGLLSFGGSNRWLAPQKGTQFINTILNQVYDLQPTLHASDFIQAAVDLNKRIRKRSLVILISNLRDEDITELQPALNLLNQHHLVMLANLREQTLDDKLETPIESMTDALEYAGTIDFLKQRHKLIEHFYSQGVISIDTVPKHLATQIVNNYFKVKRSGRL